MTAGLRSLDKARVVMLAKGGARPRDDAILLAVIAEPTFLAVIGRKRRLEDKSYRERTQRIREQRVAVTEIRQCATEAAAIEQVTNSVRVALLGSPPLPPLLSLRVPFP